MVFSSVAFIFVFLPVALIGNHLLPGITLKNCWLLILSLLFFSYGQPQYLWIILLITAINYSGAVLIEITAGKFLRKCIFLVTIIISLSFLFYYKYFNFITLQLSRLLPVPLHTHEIILPVGISFFTFQALSYTIDVWYRRTPAQRNPFKLALYICLFPQLIAGPIVRYTDIRSEIDRRFCTSEAYASGIRRFIIGLARKALIANTLALSADNIWSSVRTDNSLPVAWIGMIMYGLQIYFDFSAYSDMAIGLGQLLGFHFPENFDLPYAAKSVSTFWRRWHISLSSWFRDYVYIPLGGNRMGQFRTCRNLLIVFFLTGLWHGASWNFIFWGLWHGSFLLLERILRFHHISAESAGAHPILSFLQHCYTLAVVFLGWVLFRADDLHTAILYLRNLFGYALPPKPGFSVFWYLDPWTATVLLFALFLSTGLQHRLLSFFKKHIPSGICLLLQDMLLLLLLLMSVMRIAAGTYNPFIYFQF